MLTRAEFETALDEHRLWVKENWKGGPRWYLVRRNGQTRTFKRDRKDGKEWQTPVKYKLRECFTVTNTNIGNLPLRAKNDN